MGVLTCLCSQCTLVWEGEAVCGIDAWYVGSLGARREQCQVNHSSLQLAWYINDQPITKKNMKCYHLFDCASHLNLQSLLAMWSKLTGVWGGVLTGPFQGTVGGTTHIWQLAICHPNWSLYDSDIVVINLAIFLVGEPAWGVTLWVNERASNTSWENARKTVFCITQRTTGMHCVAGRAELTVSDGKP